MHLSYAVAFTRLTRTRSFRVGEVDSKRDHNEGRQRLHARRAFVRNRDGDALAADVVEVDLILLLNALAQVLRGHGFLSQLDLDAAALLLDLGKTTAQLAQGFLARVDALILRFLLCEEFSSLPVDDFALVREALNLPL